MLHVMRWFIPLVHMAPREQIPRTLSRKGPQKTLKCTPCDDGSTAKRHHTLRMNEFFL